MHGFPIQIVSTPSNPMEGWIVAAAWVQAIGSILAIVAAALIAVVPMLLAEHRRRESVRRLKAEIIGAAYFALYNFDAIHRAIDSEDIADLVEALDRVHPTDRDALDAYCELPPGAWPSVASYLAGRKFRHVMTTFLMNTRGNGVHRGWQFMRDDQTELAEAFSQLQGMLDLVTDKN